jgi:hypothetical protein
VLAYQRRYKDFSWLVGYLLGPEREAGPARVEWTTTRNLPTSDPDLAATVMADTAGQNPRTKKPVYHILLSAAPGDPIDRAKMERMADRVLDRLGLTEHQAVLVAHLDRPHHHLHIMVNRVHPQTGRAWSSWQDWAPVMEVLREEERALGLRQAPSPTRELSRDLAIHERVVALSREQQAAEAEANAARARAMRLEQTAARARATRDRREKDLAQVYRDPRKAHSAYLAAADREGLAVATERMRERPDDSERCARLSGVARSASRTRPTRDRRAPRRGRRRLQHRKHLKQVARGGSRRWRRRSALNKHSPVSSRACTRTPRPHVRRLSDSQSSAVSNTPPLPSAPSPRRSARCGRPSARSRVSPRRS